MLRRIIWFLTLRFSRMLSDPLDEEPVLGDMEERELSGSLRGFWEVMQLVVLRQSNFWRGWRLWTGVVTLTFSLAAMYGCAYSIGQMLAQVPWHDDAHFTVGDIAMMTFWGSVATIVWSWSVGFTMRWIARAAIPSLLPIIAVASLVLGSQGWSLHWWSIGSLVILVGLPLWLGLRSEPLGTRQRMGIASVAVIAFASHLLGPGFRGVGFEPSMIALGLAVLWPLGPPVLIRRRCDGVAKLT